MKVTLNDIAQKMGVTASTVQRALNGSAGVSEQKRAEIAKTANDMGYKHTTFGVGPRSAERRIAVVLPDALSRNRYYGRYLWAGIERYTSECTGGAPSIIRLTYETSPDMQVSVLEALLSGAHGPFDGVVTRGSKYRELSDCLRKFEQKNIPLVLAGADSEPKHRICCVNSYEEMAGRMAADLMLQFGAISNQNRVLVCGNFTTVNQFNNSQGFERQMWESDVRPNVIKLSSDTDSAEVKDKIKEMIISGTPIGGVYACSARSSVAVGDAIKECGAIGRVRAIGSDIFAESVRHLREGSLSAIIHNQPMTIAYEAMKVLDTFLKREMGRPPSSIGITPLIVMRSNMEYYMKTLMSLRLENDLRPGASR